MLCHNDATQMALRAVNQYVTGPLDVLVFHVI